MPKPAGRTVKPRGALSKTPAARAPKAATGGKQGSGGGAWVPLLQGVDSHANLKAHGRKGIIKYFQEVKRESKLDFGEATAEEFRYRR